MDPEDDPNNQGEDEFEEAEDEQPQHRTAEEEEEGMEEEEEPAQRRQHVNTHPDPKKPAVDEGLVVSKGTVITEKKKRRIYAETTENTAAGKHLRAESGGKVADWNRKIKEMRKEGH